MIKFQNVSFSYGAMQGQRSIQAVRQLSLSIERGAHVALIGRNGSGKSTMARLMNGLLLPDEGLVMVGGKLTADDDSIYEIRRQCGMVFQNPDNQIIGTTVKDDVAFGPSNLGLPPEEIFRRVDQSLAMTGLSDLKDRAPHELSGGQKQKLAIASVLAMRPDCLILDEATAMLDPVARREVMALITRLKKDQGITIVQITHHMEEALLADYVYVIGDGRIAFEGTPAQVFDQVGRVKSEGLAVPAHLEIARLVSERAGVSYDPDEIVSFDGAVRFVSRVLAGHPAVAINECLYRAPADESVPAVVEVRDLSHAYDSPAGPPIQALDSVSFALRQGEVLGIAGHTGSGKSTLIQHLNGLITAGPGKVMVLGRDLSEKKEIRRIRRQVGLLFQYPEDQLFEETVALDIAFAPKQQKKPPAEVEEAVLKAAVRLGVADVLDRSPFELSGGQRRRVAIAGVLAAEPDIVILDEPAAGLDPAGRDDLFRDLLTLSAEGATLIIVSHDMEMMTCYADRILVLKEGRAAGMGTPAQMIASAQFLDQAHLDMPAPKRFLDALKADFQNLDTSCFNVTEAADALLPAKGRLNHG
ncbi:MAG TPA: energy-coupling factor transporter ATPase [Bacillota bacterium]|nr:energy-coupling factor transporter ATPase [Fastidiosipila sp.]HPX93270.1 energy-coupling factor transporter ATPase [Bacillota bacterium]HQB80929.1 energy-coupling factor transporter ATPase [Bacillota bacterium]